MLTDRCSPSQFSLLDFARILTTVPTTTITYTHAHTNVAAPVPLITSCISKKCTELATADAATTNIAADYILTAAPPPPIPPARTQSNPLPAPCALKTTPSHLILPPPLTDPPNSNASLIAIRRNIYRKQLNAQELGLIHANNSSTLSVDDLVHITYLACTSCALILV